MEGAKIMAVRPGAGTQSDVATMSGGPAGIGRIASTCRRASSLIVWAYARKP